MVVGSLEIGEPDASLINQDYSIVELAVYTIPDKKFYSSYCRGAVYLSYALGAHVYAHFNLDSPFTQLPSESSYISSTSKHADMFLSSVDQLQPLYIYLQNRYGKIYTITLQPYQIYRQLPSGKYQLLIQQQSDDLNYIAFGNTIFDTYYIDLIFKINQFKQQKKPKNKKHQTLEGSKSCNEKLIQNMYDITIIFFIIKVYVFFGRTYININYEKNKMNQKIKLEK
ncbi:transmembrane protein, putative (macronuclear) [Tetrahymena thermophila SB210]|uniref:Transmembrane protein, putative n=1 Tax=Tetrahymena thermophila (strain SB210) TaxID=312017 RepID=Q23U72_TETTS|nr:transmembrane protein, putative [Tetrahymena thermophila SB210]EAS00072.2 transmembrane protein, putative [Tetrahymena thermophila SB210]|eukprot:XP_001020317.2 transmembrane protein, putative [Tetrahymena thermophila SB210]